MEGRVRINMASQLLDRPSHVRSNNVPSLSVANTNQNAVPAPSTQNLKRSHSSVSSEESSDSDDDDHGSGVADGETYLKSLDAYDVGGVW